MAAERQKKNTRNPYIISGPIQDPKQFFDRQDLLNWILGELSTPGRNALVLHGQRRIGKTSLLHQLSHTLLAGSFLPIYFDLQERATKPTVQTLLELCAAVNKETGVGCPAQELFDPHGYYLQHEHLPKVYAALGNVRRPIFLLDEFDVLARYATGASTEGEPARELLKIIQRILNNDTFSAFIFVVRRPAEDFPLDFSAVFRESGIQEVWVPDREGAEGIIRQAEANQTLAFSPDAIQRVIQLTSRHPYLTQMMGHMIWERAYQANPREIPLITSEKVEAAIPDTLQGASQALNWLWLSMRPVEKFVAAAVADSSEEGVTVSTEQLVQMLAQHAARLQVKEVLMAPQELVHRRLLEEVGAGEYRFAMELFRQFVKQTKPLEALKIQLETSDPLIAHLFEIGQGFMKKNQPGNAIRYFQDALQANAQHFPSRLHLGEALMLNKQYIQAVQELEQAFNHDPDVAKPLLMQATVQMAKNYAQEGEHEKALAAFGRVLQLAPNQEDANQYWKKIWMQRGNEALKQGDLRAAIEAFRQGGDGEMAAKLELIDRRASLVSLEAQGLQFVRAKEWGRAASVYEKLIAQAPDLEGRSTWQATLELCREEYELADLFQQGKEALNQKDMENAQRAFLAILYRQVNYRVGNERASQLLDMAVKAMSYNTPQFPPPVIPEAERLLVSISSENVDRLKPVITRGNGIPLDIVTSADGQYLAVATSLGISIYNAQTLAAKAAKIIQNIPTPAWVNCLAISKNSQYLAAGCQNQSVYIYQTEDWSIVRAFNRHAGAVTCLAFSPDQSLLAVGTKTPVIYVWRLSDGKMMRILEGHNEAIRSLVFSPDGSLIVSGCDDRTIRLWRGTDGFPVGILPAHTAPVTGLAFTPDSRTLVSGSADKTLRLWRASTRKLTQTIQGGFGAITCLTLTPDGQTAIVGSEDQQVWLIPLSGKTQPTAIEGHSAGVIGIAHAADRNTLFSIGLDGALRSWHLSQTIQPGSVELFSQAIFTLAYAPDGKSLAIGLLDGKIEILDANDLSLIRSIQVHPGPIYSLAFSPDGQSLATAQQDSNVHLWQVSDGSLKQTLEGHTQPVLNLCFSEDGKLLATASHDQTAILWQAEGGALVRKLQKHKESISCVAFSPSGQFLATGSADKNVQLWQVSDGKPIQTLTGHQASIHQLAFSPNGNWLASASEDQTLCIWQVSNGALLQSLEGFEGSVYSLAFSPNSQILAGGSRDQMIRIWETHLWKELGILKAHTGGVTCLAFTPDGSRLASGSEDGTLRIWSAD